MLAMYWLVNRFGTNATAAYSVVFRIDSFASMPAMNFAMALSAFVGQNLGAQKPERVRQRTVIYILYDGCHFNMRFHWSVFSSPGP